MQEEDWTKEFEEIAQEIDFEDLADPRSLEVLTPWEVQRMVVLFNEAASYLGEHLLDVFVDKSVTLPSEVTHLMRHLVNSADSISREIAIFASEECPDCTDTNVCEDCYERLEEEEDLE